MTTYCDHCGQPQPEWGGVILDDERGELRYGGYSVYLTCQEHALMRMLLDKKGRVVTKDSLMNWLYQLEQKEAEDKIIDVYVCKIRRKMGQMALKIGTQWGRGYFLEVPINGAAHER